MGYKFWEYEIPDYVMNGLERYVEKHIKPGGFLTAVLENNFAQAVAEADDVNILQLKAYMGWLYNEAPSDCWGSPEKVRTWLKNK